MTNKCIFFACQSIKEIQLEEAENLFVVYGEKKNKTSSMSLSNFDLNVNVKTKVTICFSVRVYEDFLFSRSETKRK